MRERSLVDDDDDVNPTELVVTSSCNTAKEKKFKMCNIKWIGRLDEFLLTQASTTLGAKSKGKMKTEKNEQFCWLQK